MKTTQRERDMDEHPASSKERLTNRLLARLRRISPRMHAISVGAVAVGTALAIATLIFMRGVIATHATTDTINTEFESCRQATDELQQTSDYLTNQARSYVNAGKPAYLNDYLHEVFVSDNRGKAIDTLKELAHEGKATRALEGARSESDRLAETELYALRLAADYYGLEDVPEEIARVVLTSDDARLPGDQKWQKAYELVYGTDYNRQKLAIREQTQTSSELLFESLRQDMEEADATIDTLVGYMRISVIGLLLVVLFGVTSTMYLILWPMSMHAESIRNDKSLEPLGAAELRYLTDAYNEMYAKNQDEAESLSYEAHYDALTGVLNRKAYDDLLSACRHNCALILVDVDKFKNFNDDFGHEMGDAVLVEVSATLYASFRATDHICRIGGDEFAVIVTDFEPESRDVISRKLDKVAEFLRDTSNGLPSVTVSCGIAFGHMGITQDDLFKAADGALYETKRRGRDGYTFA